MIKVLESFCLKEKAKKDLLDLIFMKNAQSQSQLGQSRCSQCYQPVQGLGKTEVIHTYVDPWLIQKPWKEVIHHIQTIVT